MNVQRKSWPGKLPDIKGRTAPNRKLRFRSGETRNRIPSGNLARSLFTFVVSDVNFPTHQQPPQALFHSSLTFEKAFSNLAESQNQLIRPLLNECSKRFADGSQEICKEMRRTDWPNVEVMAVLCLCLCLPDKKTTFFHGYSKICVTQNIVV